VTLPGEYETTMKAPGARQTRSSTVKINLALDRLTVFTSHTQAEDEIGAPVTSSLRTAGGKPGTEEGDAAVAIAFGGWAVVR
jgi:hypothetical protein